MAGELNQWIFEYLTRLADGIVAVLGPQCEVVVHDLEDLQHSVVAVAGNLTGRCPGSPVPDLSFTPEELETTRTDLLNYRTMSGGRAFQTSTVWLRDHEGKIIGAVCINVDYSGLQQARDVLNRLAAPADVATAPVVETTFARDLDELIDRSIDQFLEQEQISSLEEAGRQARLRLIQALDRRGLFKIRGAAEKLADLLHLSRASIYNYRSIAQNGD